MALMCRVSRSLARLAIGFRQTPAYTQHELSRGNMWFGSGGSRKSSTYSDVGVTGLIPSPGLSRSLAELIGSTLARADSDGVGCSRVRDNHRLSRKASRLSGGR